MKLKFNVFKGMFNFIKHKKKIVAIVCIIAVGGVSFYSVKAKTSSQVIERIPSTTTVQKGDLSKRVSATGTARAADENSIFIELSQEVDEVFVEVGDQVEEGQLLVTYDIADTKKELENKLKQAQINYDNALISLNEIAEPATGAELIDLQNQVISAQKNIDDTKTEIQNTETKIAQAERDLETTKTTMENNEKLYELGGISKDTLDSSKNAYEDALTSLEEMKQSKTALENSLESLELNLEKANLNLQTGTDKLSDSSNANNYEKQKNSLETAQISIDEAQEDINKLTDATYSPISGTVIECNAVEGQMLTDSTVMMTIADLTNIDLDASISEYDISNIKVGQKVEITSDGIEGKVYTGTVRKIEPVASSQGTFSGEETVVPVVIHMDDPDERVMPGISFDIEIITEDLSDVSYIPISSVSKDDEGNTFVYTVNENDILEKTTVELGTYSDMYVELVSGLSEGEKIVETIADDMKEGTSLSDYKTEITVNSNEEQESSIMENMGGASMQGMPSGGMPAGGGMPSGGGRGGMR